MRRECSCNSNKTCPCLIIDNPEFNKISLQQSESPGCRGRALALYSKGQWFDPWRRHLEKVVYLDENSWTQTKLIKPSFIWPSDQSRRWATMSAVVRLVHVQFQLETYMKDIISRSTKKQTVTELQLSQSQLTVKQNTDHR